MFRKTCRCGKSSNNFYKDIGPFYIEECCEEAGYDHLGNKKITKTPEDPSFEPKTPEEAISSPKIPERWRLKEMRRDQVAEIASQHGISVDPKMTKVQLMDLLHPKS